MTDDDAAPPSQPPAPAPDAPDSVERLVPGDSGRWHLHTRSAIHVVDIDAGTYERRPGPDSEDFGTDGMVHEFNRISLPEVGRSLLVYFDDPEDYYRERWHRTSRVRRIVRAPADDVSS